MFSQLLISLEVWQFVVWLKDINDKSQNNFIVITTIIMNRLFIFHIMKWPKCLHFLFLQRWFIYYVIINEQLDCENELIAKLWICRVWCNIYFGFGPWSTVAFCFLHNLFTDRWCRWLCILSWFRRLSI